MCQMQISISAFFLYKIAIVVVSDLFFLNYFILLLLLVVRGCSYIVLMKCSMYVAWITVNRAVLNMYRYVEYVLFVCATYPISINIKAYFFYCIHNEHKQISFPNYAQKSSEKNCNMFLTLISKYNMLCVEREREREKSKRKLQK